MKRLSDFQDEAGIILVSRLMLPIGRIAQNRAVLQARTAAKAEGRDMSVLELASVMLSSGARDIMEMLALLNEEDPAEYHCSAATVLADVMKMFSDPDLQALFGLQSSIPASSGSASESTEGQKTPDASSPTAGQKPGGTRKKKSGGDM